MLFIKAIFLFTRAYMCIKTKNRRRSRPRTEKIRKEFNYSFSSSFFAKRSFLSLKE